MARQPRYSLSAPVGAQPQPFRGIGVDNEHQSVMKRGYELIQLLTQWSRLMKLSQPWIYCSVASFCLRFTYNEKSMLLLHYSAELPERERESLVH